MIMRYIALLMAAGAVAGACAQEPAALSPQMRTFGESAVLMMQGLQAHDPADLTDAAEGFASLNYSELDSYGVEEATPGDLTGAIVQFNDEYCDLVRKNNFVLVELDPLTMVRATMPEIFLVTKAIKAGGEVTLSFEGSDTVNLAIAASEPSALTLNLSADGNEIPLSTEKSGYVSSAVWDMGPGDNPFSLRIANPSAETVSFTIALE